MRMEELYFKWLYDMVYDEESMVSYTKLLRHLFYTDFVAIMLKDENRASDGIDLRYEFGEMECLTPDEVTRYIDRRPCSMLEMMIALSIRIEHDIMSEDSCGDRTGQWFWNMIVNLGLGGMSDEDFDRYYVNNCLDTFMHRDYTANGDGGLFTMDDTPYDLREVEIWYQAMWYLNNNYYN